MAMRTYEDFPIQDLQLYAGIDCIVTSDLFTKIFPVISEQPSFIKSTNGKLIKSRAPSILHYMENYGMPIFDFIVDMEINGLSYDVDKNREINQAMIEEISVLEDNLATKIGKAYDWDKEVGKYLYHDLGLEPLDFTKTGEPSVDGDAVKKLAKTHGLDHLSLLAKRNDITSVHRTFIKSYVEDFLKPDGRLHPSYNQHGTSSFRISGENPNLTQLPRKKHGYNVRQCYNARPGYVFLTFDFSSCEVKILGALCRDPKLLKAIREGKDFHSVSASALYNLDYDEFIAVLGDENHPKHRAYKEMRQASKALTFGILYGSSPAGIAYNLGISVAEAENLIRLYFDEYPLIRNYVQDSHNMAVYNQFVITNFGQRKQELGTLPMYKKSAVYNAAKRNSQNIRVQGTASTIGLMSFAELNKEIKRIDGYSICTVFDSYESEVLIERAAEAIELGFKYMDDMPVEMFEWLELPIGTDAEIGFNWGDLHKVHRGITQEEVNRILLAA